MFLHKGVCCLVVLLFFGKTYIVAYSCLRYARQKNTSLSAGLVFEKVVMTCFFKERCRHYSEHCLSSGNLNSPMCNHFHIGQNIMSRRGVFFGVELLSRPFNALGGREFDSYFSSLPQSKHNLLLIEIINKIHSFQHSTLSSVGYDYFVNVERFSLLDSVIVESLCSLSKAIESAGSRLVVEITERHEGLYNYTAESEYALKDSNALLALDDFTYDSCLVLDSTRHDFIKLDLRHVKENLKSNDFIDWLYLVKELGIKIVAERVEVKEDYNLALSLPFDYFQGYYEGLSYQSSCVL